MNYKIFSLVNKENIPSQFIFVSVFCDHTRAADYFIDAISNPNSLIASKCLFSMGYFRIVSSQETVALGDLSTKKTCKFYLETNRKEPYSKCGRRFINTGMEKVLSILPGIN